MLKTIASTAKISAKVMKDGSMAGRDAYCFKLENKLFNRLKKYKRTQFDYIEKNINDILPDKLIKVEKIPVQGNEYSGSVMLASDKSMTIPANVAGYIVELKQNCKKEHFGGVNIGILMHEAHHLFSHLTHPKYPGRIFKVSKLSDSYNFEDFFVKHFQSPMHLSESKIKTQKLLDVLPEHKIDLLQYFRYKLIDEIGAYQSGKYFLDKYRLVHNIKKYSQSINQVSLLFLREKLNMITEMLNNALKIERDNYHKILENNCTSV